MCFNAGAGNPDQFQPPTEPLRIDSPPMHTSTPLRSHTSTGLHTTVILNMVSSSASSSSSIPPPSSSSSCASLITKLAKEINGQKCNKLFTEGHGDQGKDDINGASRDCPGNNDEGIGLFSNDNSVSDHEDESWHPPTDNDEVQS